MTDCQALRILSLNELPVSRIKQNSDEVEFLSFGLHSAQLARWA